MQTRTNSLATSLQLRLATVALGHVLLVASAGTAQEPVYGAWATDSLGEQTSHDGRHLPNWMASTGVFGVPSEATASDHPFEFQASHRDRLVVDSPETSAWSTGFPTGFSKDSLTPEMLTCGDNWCWQTLPAGLIYHSYLASVREPRLAAQWVKDRDRGWKWDIALGGRVGLFRYGTTDTLRPEGWQLDVEGAALPRLDMEMGMDLMATDYRVGVPLTYGRGCHQTKLAFYHLSSHLGDEYMEKNPSVSRINYSRDVVVLGHSYFWNDDIRLYGEAAWAFNTDGGTLPWEFQFGVDYSPARPTGRRPVPFVAVNVHLRQEVDFGGNFVAQSGLQWRGVSGHLFRVGVHYFTGMSEQGEFFSQFEDKIGLGVWYDF